MAHFPVEAGMERGAVRLWSAGQQLKSAKLAGLQHKLHRQLYQNKAICVLCGIVPLFFPSACFMYSPFP